MARTALIASSFLPRTGGVEVHVASVATELVRHGHDVVIWATDQGDDVPAYFQDIPLRYLPCPMPARTLAATVRFAASAPSAWQSWRRALAADRPDVLHIQCFGPNGVYASALSLATGLPLVYSHHGETSGDANDVFGTSALLRSALRTTLTRASAVTSCSAHAAADLARFGRDPGTVDVIWNGIDDAEPVGTAPFGLPAKYVLGVGRLVANKGFANLIRAYAEARPDAALVIGGDGPELDRLRELAAGLAVTVHFPGQLSRPEVGAVMAGAEALIVPSLAEAFGIAVLEGWRAGVPVAATNRGGPPEFVTDEVNALLFDPEDVGSLAGILRRLAADPQLRHRLGVAGRAAVNDFTWARTAASYSAIYARIVRTT
ncbi:MAG TPA: glycosyltransferase family 4 protein [Actinomycetota bacterium]|nr:glycosyltransferase family 4 protein [Actinomycetota bacterium]